VKRAHVFNTAVDVLSPERVVLMPNATFGSPSLVPDAGRRLSRLAAIYSLVLDGSLITEIIAMPVVEHSRQ